MTRTSKTKTPHSGGRTGSLATVHRTTPKSGFTIMRNSLWRDKSLSTDARFMHGFLISLPPNWRIHMAHLMTEFGWARDRTYGAMRELKDGDLVLHRQSGGSGRARQHEYHIFDTREACRYYAEHGCMPPDSDLQNPAADALPARQEVQDHKQKQEVSHKPAVLVVPDNDYDLCFEPDTSAAVCTSWPVGTASVGSARDARIERTGKATKDETGRSSTQTSHPYPPSSAAARPVVADGDAERIPSTSNPTEAAALAGAKTRARSKPETPRLDGKAVEEAMRLWNEMAERADLPKVRGVASKDRIAGLKSTLAKFGGLEGFAELCERVERSSWCRGVGTRNGWKARFDFLTQASSCEKLLEGFYDDRPAAAPQSEAPSKTQPKPPSEALLAAVPVRDRLLRLAGDKIDRHRPSIKDTATIAEWLGHGADVEKDIVPAVESTLSTWNSGRQVHSWRLFNEAVLANVSRTAEDREEWIRNGVAEGTMVRDASDPRGYRHLPEGFSYAMWHGIMSGRFDRDGLCKGQPWPEDYGPAPGSPGCLVPPTFLIRYGFKAEQAGWDRWRADLEAIDGHGGQQEELEGRSSSAASAGEQPTTIDDILADLTKTFSRKPMLEVDHV